MLWENFVKFTWSDVFWGIPYLKNEHEFLSFAIESNIQSWQNMHSDQTTDSSIKDQSLRRRRRNGPAHFMV